MVTARQEIGCYGYDPQVLVKRLYKRCQGPVEHTANSNERDVNRNPGIGGENISHVTLGTAAIFFHIPVLSPFQAVSMMSRPLYDEDGMCPSLDSHKQRNL